MGSPRRGGIGTCAPSEREGFLGKAHEHRGEEEPRRDRHDADGLVGEVARGRERQAHDAALGGRVGGLPDLAFEGGDRGGVDDHPALAGEGIRLDHLLGGEAQDVEGADEVDHDDAGELLQGHGALAAQNAAGGADARAADGDVQPAELCRSRDRRAHAGLVGDVGGDGDGAVAQRRRDVFATGEVGDHHRGARGVQRLCGRAPQPRCPAGDQRHPTRDLHAAAPVVAVARSLRPTPLQSPSANGTVGTW